MDSPQSNINSDSNRLISATSSSSSSSLSPKVQESPFFSYLRNLSPIKSIKATKYVQRFSQTSYCHVPPPPVFTSPRMDLQRESCFVVKRKETDHVNGNSEFIPYFQGGDKSPCSLSECIDDYLTDPVDMEGTTNTISKADDHVETKLFSGPFSGAQHHEQLVPQAAADGQDNEVSDDFFPQPLQIVGAYKDSGQSSRPAQRGFVKEADQHQRGIRRHLQFGAKMGCKDAEKETNDNANSSLPDCLADFESLVPLPAAEPNRTLSSWQAVDHPQIVTILPSFCPSQSARSAQNCRHNASACISPGLGLHLTGSSRCMNTSKKLASNLHEQEEKLMSDGDHGSANDLDSISIPSFAIEIYAHVEDHQLENQAAGTVGSATFPINIMQHPCDYLYVTQCEQQVVPYEGRTLTSANNDTVGELNQVSPKRNRKRAKHINESEGCKRCNCKRSKCLKLYCECFAAGVYCLDSCACENCLNKPEYEDTVLDTRQQIEARNPLAFAPKVVKQTTNSPANVVEEGNWTTPSSARHKRGCNCKKSKCLKKYCECYQAGVGCSNGCRCEGCNNSYGKKAESIYKRAERWEKLSHEKLESFETQDDFIKAGRAHHFSSTWEEFVDITPTHRHSGPGATSASLNIGDSSNISQAQARQQRNLQSPAEFLQYHHSPISSTPRLDGSKAMPELSPDSLLYKILEEDDAHQILNTNCTPTKILKVSSPNKKRVSPPQSRSQEFRSSNSRGLRSGRKFNLPDVPSFPPLTPYSKLKDEVQQIDADRTESTISK